MFQETIQELNEDLKLLLLAQEPIEIENVCKVYPLSLREIIKIKYSQYNKCLSNIIFDVEDILKDVEKEKLQHITTFDIISHNIIYSFNKQEIEYLNFIKECFSLFIKEEIDFTINGEEVYIIVGKDDKRIIDNNNYHKIVNILKLQNCIEDKKQKPKMANKKAEEIRQKLLKGRAKTNKNDNVSFSDLVSVLASNGNGLNILNVMDLTMYTFNDQFNRMQMIEEYDINIRSLLAGAKQEDIKLKHYIRPIDKKSDDL